MTSCSSSASRSSSPSSCARRVRRCGQCGRRGQEGGALSGVSVTPLPTQGRDGWAQGGETTKRTAFRFC
eukprot:335894-Chlamydomonas_euryale.AAC.1